jgi:hypothetical protein
MIVLPKVVKSNTYSFFLFKLLFYYPDLPMSDQSAITTKEELLIILRETIETISNTPDEDIEKRKTKMNTENGIGYYISNKDIHCWIVKKS